MNPTHFAKMLVALKFFSAAFIDGYSRLTAPAVRRSFPMQAVAGVATFALFTMADAGEGPMQRTDRSVAILTGMIIAALYVILLVGVSRESYMRQDAAARAHLAVTGPATEDVSKRACRIELPCPSEP